MRRYFLILSVFCLAALSLDVQGQERCHTDEVHAALLADSAFARSYFAFEAAMEDMASSGALRSSTTHVLPVVVHVMHDGSDLGTGSNISDAQVQSAIEALNADFRGDFGGAQVDIEFELAARDPDGNPSSGIVRVDVSAQVPSYTSTGMVTSSSSDPASELAVKSMSHWPSGDYINVWVVHKLNGGASPIGFAYLPPFSGTLDGIVVHRQVFGVGDQYDLYNNYDLNRTLTHEVGHYLGLLHTFNNTSSCAAESNCQTQGDKVCDTPPTTGSLGCSALDCPNTMVENFMDYANDDCMDSFTEGQRTRMRDALENYRASLLNSDGTVPVMSSDVGLTSLEGVANSGCNATVQPQVLLQNFGTEPMTTATVYFALDGGVENPLPWSGNLSTGESVMIDLPGLATGAGNHTLSVWSAAPGDGYADNDTITVDFEVTGGMVVEMDIQFDPLPYGISWSIVDVSDGSVVMSGDDYDNATYSMSNVIETDCVVSGCYELIVEDAFGNGMHYQPQGSYTLTDVDGNVLGTGGGNFGAQVTHAFCIDGGSMTPCADTNGNGVCDEDEGILTTDVPGCTDEASCTYDAGANTDDGSCEYLDALGECGGDCPGDADSDGVCDNAEIPGCTDVTACNFDASATDDAGNCSYPPVNYDCDGNITVVVNGCTDEASCTYDAGANTDDGSCEYLDALGECGGDCPGDADSDGICDNAEIPGCMDATACNYDTSATDANGACTYPDEGYDCDGNVLVPVEGCTDPMSCTFDAEANTDDGSCQYLDALGDCGGDCPNDVDGDGVCDNAEIPGCTDVAACNFAAGATEADGSCIYPDPGFDCNGDFLVIEEGCTDPLSCTFDADANTDDGSCQYLDAIGECGGDCAGDADEDGVCDDAEIPGCMDPEACNYDPAATDDAGNCSYPPINYDCEGNVIVVISGCTDPESCTYDADANTDDGSCEYLDAIGECGGDCLGDADGDGICDDAEIAGCTDEEACNYDEAATDESGGCEYAEEGYDCEGNPLVNSIGEKAPELALSAFPNPVNMGVSFRISGLDGEGPWLAQWHDAAGRVVCTQVVTAGLTNAGSVAILNTPDVPGIFTVKVQASSLAGGQSRPTSGLRILVH